MAAVEVWQQTPVHRRSEMMCGVEAMVEEKVHTDEAKRPPIRAMSEQGK